MISGALGKIYEDGDCVYRAGDAAEDIYVVQHGQVDLTVTTRTGAEIVVCSLTTGDIFGQPALFRQAPRHTTARARGQSRVLTITRRAFLQRIHEDPSLAFQTLRGLSFRIERMMQEMAELKSPPGEPPDQPGDRSSTATP